MDFPDPQGGKGCCDCKAASIKSHIKIYFNEGHNVENIWQMKQAIESHGGNEGVIVFIVVTAFFCERTKHQPRRHLRSYLVL